MSALKSGLHGWITAAVTIAGILVAIGVVYREVCASAEANIRQDCSINTLQTDMAVIKATTSRTAMDVDELKIDIKKLLQRP